MIHNKFRYLLTLVALFAISTGAWAEEKSETISTNTSQEEYTGEHFKITPNIKPDGLTVADLRYYADGQVYFSVQTLDGQNISKLDLQINYIDDTSIDNLSLSSGTKSYDSNTHVLTITNVNADHVQISLTEEDEFGIVKISSVTYYYEESASGPEVTWNAATKTGTFTQPGYNVVLTPVYAPAAAFATEGEEPNVKTLAPTAAEGVIAGTSEPLIVEGTVAAGQGTVMYAVTTDANAPALSAFSADLPTASAYDDATTVNVWYYIQGADTPEGQTATLENTFNDSEICATPIEVTLLTNKFDITFNALNANTIDGQNGKGTVTVKTGDAEAVDKTADIDEKHKLKAVKMGSTVTINAANGYKFRKVEAKKGGAAPAPAEGPTLAQTLTTANMTVKVYYTYNDMNNTCEFLSNGDGTYTFQSGTGLVGGDSGKAKALVVENGKLVFKQNFFETIVKLWAQVGFAITFDTSENTYSIWKGSNETITGTLSKVEVNGTQIAVTQQ